MKKLFSAASLSFFLLLNNSSFAFASAGYVNPIPNSSGNGYHEDPNKPPSTAMTSLILMFSNGSSPTGSRTTSHAAIIPGACYLLGRGNAINWESVGNGKWWNLKDRHTSGWSQNNYALQAGGDVCGFVNGSIKGSGPDTAANFVRANPDGEVWYYNLCTNFEGVRTDCNEKFALNKGLSETLFQVVCQYNQKDAEGNIVKDSSGKPVVVIDNMCDINKADINPHGQAELHIFDDNGNGDGSGSDTKIFQQAYPKILEHSFSILTDLIDKKNFNPESETVQTELGLLSRDPAELATAAVRIGIGIGGGLAFLLMVYGSFRLIFAGGNPESVQQGREIITAAIIGLLVIIFATFILQLVGISILGLKL